MEIDSQPINNISELRKNQLFYLFLVYVTYNTDVLSHKRRRDLVH